MILSHLLPYPQSRDAIASKNSINPLCQYHTQDIPWLSDIEGTSDEKLDNFDQKEGEKGEKWPIKSLKTVKLDIWDKFPLIASDKKY